MLSIDFVRENKKKVEEALINKNRKADVDEILALDDKRKALIHEIQSLRNERNTLSKQSLTEEGKQKGRVLKETIKECEARLSHIETELHTKMSFLPNVPLDEVPIGKDSSGNVQLKTWGTPKVFDFSPLDHMKLGTKLDIIDFERGTKVSGFRGYFLKNKGAILHLALLLYVFQKLSKKGYVPLIAPSIVKGFTLFGTGQFPWGEQEVYKLNDDDAYLAGTAEVPVTSYFSDEILAESDLPKKFVAFSPCFRKEAGSYGKDTKGLYRLHEFWKIEQVIIGKNNLDEAKVLHEELQANSEEILQDLGLPFRTLLMCTGDMGEPQIKKYDTETWMPSRKAYGETMSNSIMGDFQTRRLKIRYRGRDGQIHHCFSYNNTAVASPRILIALLENYQNSDGTVSIPEVLRTYTGFSSIELP